MENVLDKKSDFFNSSHSGKDMESVGSKIKKKGSRKKKLDESEASKTSLQRKFENSNWYKQEERWKGVIKKLKEDLKTSKKGMEVLPPKLNVFSIYDADTLKRIHNNLMAQFERNLSIVRSLYIVHVEGAKTETLFRPIDKSSYSNYKLRRDEAKSRERMNLVIKEKIKNAKPRVMTAKEHAEEWEKSLAMIENFAQFPLYWKVEEKEAEKTIPPPKLYVKQYVTEKSVKYPDKRPRVFLEISLKNAGVVGRMTAMLYSDYVPMTVKNFLAFIDPKAPLTYKGNLLYLVFPNFYCQTGDVVENKGFGGTSIYGPYFGNEDVTLKHSERGTLTMFSKIPQRNASQFLITFRKLESLDGQNVVFGKIIRGLHVLEAIESVGSAKTGRPKVKMYISDCDEI